MCYNMYRSSTYSYGYAVTIESSKTAPDVLFERVEFYFDEEFQDDIQGHGGAV